MTIAAVLSLAGTGTLAHFTDTEASIGNVFTAGVWEVPPQGVVIDIWPYIWCNPIHHFFPYIPVAILSTRHFDASDVDPGTVRFGPDGAKPMHFRCPPISLKIDVDWDNDLDMILFFKTKHTGIEYGDTQATLIGRTLPRY